MQGICQQLGVNYLHSRVFGCMITFSMVRQCTQANPLSFPSCLLCPCLAALMPSACRACGRDVCGAGTLPMEWSNLTEMQNLALAGNPLMGALLLCAPHAYCLLPVQASTMLKPHFPAPAALYSEKGRLLKQQWPPWYFVTGTACKMSQPRMCMHMPAGSKQTCVKTATLF